MTQSDSGLFVFIPVLYLTKTVLFSSAPSQEQWMTLSSPGRHLRVVRAGARRRSGASLAGKISMFGLGTLGTLGHWRTGLVRYRVEQLRYQGWHCQHTGQPVHSTLYIISYTLNIISHFANYIINYHILGAGRSACTSTPQKYPIDADRT